MKNNNNFNFKVPEGYFSELESSILKKTIYLNKSKPSNKFLLNVKFMAVASILLFASLFIYYNKEVGMAYNKLFKNQELEEKKLIENIYKLEAIEKEISYLGDPFIYDLQD